MARTVRLRNENTGAIVVVPEAKAARLGSEWSPVVAAVKKAPAKKAPAKSDD